MTRPWKLTICHDIQWAVWKDYTPITTEFRTRYDHCDCILFSDSFPEYLSLVISLLLIILTVNIVIIAVGGRRWEIWGFNIARKLEILGRDIKRLRYNTKLLVTWKGKPNRKRNKHKSSRFLRLVNFLICRNIIFHWSRNSRKFFTQK